MIGYSFAFTLFCIGDLKLQLCIDLGANTNIASSQLLDKLSTPIKTGALGASSILSSVQVPAEAYDGSRHVLNRWLRVPITAMNVAGVETIVLHTDISCSRHDQT